MYCCRNLSKLAVRIMSNNNITSLDNITSLGIAVKDHPFAAQLKKVKGKKFYLHVKTAGGSAVVVPDATLFSSDTVLAVLNLFRERLPCSENFWRYKRNYDLHVKINQNQGANADAVSVMSAGSSTKTKRIASPKMRHVRALSPYSRWQA